MFPNPSSRQSRKRTPSLFVTSIPNMLTLTVGNSSSNSTINSTVLAIGSGPITVTCTSISIGNSTINSLMTSNIFYVGTINATSIGSIYANSYMMVGNTSVNATLNASTISTGGGNFNIITVTTTAVPLNVQGAASATANLFQVSNSGSVIFTVNSSGVIVGNGAGITSINAANNASYLGGVPASSIVTRSFDVLPPTAGDCYTLWHTKDAITVTEIVQYISNNAAGGTVNASFYWGTSRAAQSNVILSNSNTANITTGTSTTSFSNATVAANSYIWCNVNAVTAVSEYHCTIRFST